MILSLTVTLLGPRFKCQQLKSGGLAPCLHFTDCACQSVSDAEVTSVAGLGPRQMPWQEAVGRLNYTTMKLGKFVGFSAGSTMTGNLGQGPGLLSHLQQQFMQW